MSDRKCVELVAVYDDGTVETWEGEDAERVENVLSAEVGQEPAYVPPTTTTRPLRKVTAVRGRPCREDGKDVLVPDGRGIATYTNPGPPYQLTDLLPDGATYTRREDSPAYGRHFDFRIVVEAVPVEREDR